MSHVQMIELDDRMERIRCRACNISAGILLDRSDGQNRLNVAPFHPRVAAEFPKLTCRDGILHLLHMVSVEWCVDRKKMASRELYSIMALHKVFPHQISGGDMSDGRSVGGDQAVITGSLDAVLKLYIFGSNPPAQHLRFNIPYRVLWAGCEI